MVAVIDENGAHVFRHSDKLLAECYQRILVLEEVVAVMAEKLGVGIPFPGANDDFGLTPRPRQPEKGAATDGQDA
jgi:hypothetical protein